jgi:hypothetical protein
MAIIGLGLMPFTLVTALSAQTAPKVIVKSVSATYPAKVTFLSWQPGGDTRNTESPASGEKWIVVKATSGVGRDWSGFPANGAVVRDESGKKYSAITMGYSERREPEFYANGTFMSPITTVMFLFSIPINSKGLKFSYNGGTEFSIP